ncbi:MAG: pyrroloquinoline quinone biosynthesis peptide chaperone PqqD [Parvibaculaceae bacterium]
MSDTAQISGQSVPRFPRGVRLRHDEVRGQWILLAPERILKPDGVALEILKRCDGKATIDEIADDLATAYAADREEIARDVREFLGGLAAKRMLEL